MDLSFVLSDPALGFTAFSVRRTSYRRENGKSVPTEETLPASGCIHPGTPETVRLLPEEEQHEDFIAVYTGFALSTGESDGAEPCSTPDRLLWNGETWRVVQVKDWSMCGYCQGLAVKTHE